MSTINKSPSRYIYLSQGIIFGCLSLQMMLMPGTVLDLFGARSNGGGAAARPAVLLNTMQGWGAALVTPCLLNLYASRDTKYVHLASLATSLHALTHLVVHGLACRNTNDWNPKAMGALAVFDGLILVANFFANRSLKKKH